MANFASRKVNAYVTAKLALLHDELPVKDWSYVLPDSCGPLLIQAVI